MASRAAAYRLLATLCKPREMPVSDEEEDFDPADNLRLLLEKGLKPLSQLLSKPDIWGYRWAGCFAVWDTRKRWLKRRRKPYVATVRSSMCVNLARASAHA